MGIRIYKIPLLGDLANQDSCLCDFSRIASLRAPNQLECLLGGSESLAGDSIRTNTT